jgi:hypothetical protein
MSSFNTLKFATFSLLALLLLVPLGTVSAYSNSSNAIHTLTSPSSGGSFGISVSSDQGYVVVGSPYETVSGASEAGRVYVFSQTSGSLLYTLTSPNSQAGGQFGYAVSAADGIILVGAPDETSGGFGLAGNAYVFNIFNGAPISTLHSNFPNDNAYFGSAVAAGPVYTIGAATGNLVLIGAPGENDICGDGRAWTFIAQGALVGNGYCSPNPVSTGCFGCSVAIGGGYMAVGAQNENSGAGFVYTYHAKSGFPIATLTSPNAQSGGQFGYSVALHNGILAVGAPGEELGIGNAYTFYAVNNSLIKQFQTTDIKQTNNGFGYSVALGNSSGTITLIVGAPHEDIFGQDCTLGVCDPAAGHAYTFNALTGTLEHVYTSPNKQSNGYFGQAVSIAGKAPSIGAPGENNGAGTTYAISY